MSNILTVPVSGAIYFSDGVAGSSTIPNLSAGVALRYDNSAGLNITSFASAASASDRFSIDGASGRLFSVSDSLTGSIFSVNDASGLPIIEVESNLIDKITMGTYGSNALVVNDTKVGIGTATPAEKLSVVGNTTVTGYVSASQYFGLQSALSGAAALVGGNTLGTNLLIGTNDNFNLNLETAGSTRMTVTSAGNVGIGTTTAAAKLQIIHDASTNPLDIRRDGFLGSQLFTISNLGDITGGAAVFTPKLGHMVPALTVTGNGTFPVAIFQTGNVGIGTSTPTAKLDIADTTLAGSGGLSGSALNITQTWNTTGNPTAITLNVTNSASGSTSNLLDLQVGGATKFKINKLGQLDATSGDIVVGGFFGTNRGFYVKDILSNQPVSFRVSYYGSAFYGPVGITSSETGAPDVIWMRDAAGILAQRNGVNPQSFRVYRTYIDASNYERFFISTNVGSTSATQIGLSAAGTGQNRDLEVITGGSTRMTVTSAGNIGIGATTPQNKLDVNGDTRLGGWLHVDRTGGSITSYLALRVRGASEAGNFGNAAGNGQTEIQAVNTSGLVIGTNVTSPIILAAGGVERMRVLGSNGNVGIGTTNPQSNLEIYGATSTLTINTGDVSTTAGLRFAHRDSVYADSQIKVGIFAPAAGSFGLSTGLFFALNNATDNTNVSVSDSKLAILSNGNIGVGTTTPNERLTVSGNISSSNVVYALGGNSNLWNNTYTTVTTSSANYILDGGNTKGANILVGTNDNFNLNLETAGTTRMTVTSAGAVGIGTANPLYTLDVNGAIGTTYSGIKLGDPIYSIDVSVANSIAYKSSLNHIFYGASTELMRIGYPGNLGLGTANPIAKLDIADTTLAGSGVLSGSILNLTQTWATSGSPTAIKLNVTNTNSGAASNLLDLQVGGVSKLSVAKSGNIFVNSPTANGGSNGGHAIGFDISGTSWGFSGGAGSFRFGTINNAFLYVTTGQQWRFPGSTTIGWSPTSPDGNADLLLARDAANTLAQRNGVNPQAFRLYNTFTDTVSAFERLNIKWDANVIKIGTEKGITGGLGRAMEFQTDGTTRMTVTSAGNVGIGTTTPAYKLSVSDTSGGLPFSSFGTFSSRFYHSAYSLTYDAVGLDASNNARIHLTSTSSNASPSIDFTNSNATSRIYLSANTSENGNLNFSVQGYTTLMLRKGDNRQGNAILSSLAGDNTYNNASLLVRNRWDGSPAAVIAKLATSTTADIFQVTNESLSPYFNVNAIGNVGVGTSTPIAKLDIADTTFAGSSALSGSALNITQTWNTTGSPTAITLNVTNSASGSTSNLLDLQVGGASKFSVNKNGVAQFSGGSSRAVLFDANGGIGVNRADVSMTTALVFLGYNTAPRITIVRDGTIGWSPSQSDTSGGNATPDTVLLRDGAANILGLRNGVNPQAFRVYSTYTDASNYERFFISTNVGTTSATQIGLSAAGTGQNRGLEVVTGGSTRMTVTSVGNVGIGTTTPTEKLVVNGSFSVYPNSFNSESRLITRSIHPDGRWALDIRANAASGDVQALAVYQSFLGIGSGEFLTGAISSAIGISSNITHIPKLRIAGSGTGPNNASGLVIGSSSSTEWSSGASYPDGSNYYEIRTNLSAPAQLGAMVAVPTRAPLNIDAKYLSFLTGNTTGVEAMRIASVGNVGIGTSTPTAKLDIADTTFAGSSALSGSALNITQTWNTTGNPTAITLNVTNSASGSTSNLLNLQVGGNSKFKVNKGGSIFSGAAIGTNAGNPGADGLSLEMFFAGYGMGTNSNGDAVFYQNNVARTRVGFGVAIADGWSLGFTNASHVGANATVDTIILRDGAGTLAQRNGVNPQAFRLYNTYTDSVSAFERLNIKWDTNVIKIGTEKGSNSGSARDLVLETNAVERLRVLSTGNIQVKDSLELNTLTPLIGAVKPVLTVYRSGSGGDGCSILCKRDGGQEIGDLRFSGTAAAPDFGINLRHNYTAQSNLATFTQTTAGRGSIIFGTFNGVNSASLSVYNSNPAQNMTGINLGNLSTSAGSNIDIVFQSYTADPHATIRGIYPGGTKFGSLAFLTANGLAPVEALRITQLGNVGIGTSTPTANLQVNQSTLGTGTISISAADTTITGVNTQFLNTFKAGDTISSAGQTLTISSITSDTLMTTTSASSTITAAAYTLVGGSRFGVSGNGDISLGAISLIQRTANIDGVNANRLLATGNFGFGGGGYGVRYSTVNNSYRLVVASANSSLATAAYLFGLDGSQQNKGLIYDRNEDSISLICGPGGNSDSYSRRLTILSNGKVGIGTIAPNENLTVVGTVSAAGDFAVATSLQGVILVSPNSTRWRITVNDNGSLQTTAL